MTFGIYDLDTIMAPHPKPKLMFLMSPGMPISYILLLTFSYILTHLPLLITAPLNINVSII